MSRISARRVVATSFVVDISDIILNLIVAIASGSVVMISQTIQGGADLLTSLLLLIGVRQAARRASKKYRFGHGRELYFWLMMAGISMFTLTAATSFVLGLERFLNPQPISNLPAAFAVLAIGLCTNLYAFSLSLRRLNASYAGNLWQRLLHSSMIETKATLILDSMGAVASFLGLIALGVYGLTGELAFDGLGSMSIGVATAILAIMLIIEVKDFIVGRSATGDIEQAIRASALRVEGVQAVLDLRTMYAGSENLLVNMEVHVAEGLTTREIELLTDQIKKQARRDVPLVKHIQVEIETPAHREV